MKLPSEGCILGLLKHTDLLKYAELHSHVTNYQIYFPSKVGSAGPEQTLTAAKTEAVPEGRDGCGGAGASRGLNVRGRGGSRGSKTHPGRARQDTWGASRPLRQGLPSGNKFHEKTITGNVYLTKKTRKERSVRKSKGKSL